MFKLTIPRSLAVILVLAGMSACTSKKEKIAHAIYALETSDSSSSAKGMNDLANLYFDYAKAFTKDSISERYLYKGFMFKYITQHWDDAIEMAKFYASNYPRSESYYGIHLKLADVYYSGKSNPDSAIHHYLLADGKVAFSTDEKRTAASRMEKWSSATSNSELKPKVLLVSGRLFQAAGDFKDAVRVYGMVVSQFPAYPGCADALMAQGFIYWENLKDIENAKKSYQMLVDKYPESPLAKDAKTLLSENMLAMSDLELAEHLMKKNKP